MEKIICFFFTFLSISACSVLNKENKQPFDEKDILEHIIEARGGIEKLDQVQSIQFVVTEPQTGLYAEAFRKRPYKSLDIMKYPRETYTYILNGDSAIEISPNGRQAIIGVRLRGLREDATIFPELFHKELEQKYIYLREEHVNEKPVYQVKILLPDNRFRMQFYDKDTWLLVKKIDEVGIETHYDDYLEIEGV